MIKTGKTVLKPIYRKILVGNGNKALLERSGVRSFLGTLTAVVIGAWAKDVDIIQSIKDNCETLVPLLLMALGLSASRSRKELR